MGYGKPPSGVTCHDSGLACSGPSCDYRSLFEDAPIAYHEIDRTGAIRAVNRAECELLGYLRGELIGKPVWELVSPEQREASRAAVARK